MASYNSNGYSETHQVENNWKDIMATEIKTYYLKSVHVQVINDKINEIIDTELKNDTFGPPSDRGYAELKRRIIEKINKTI